MGKKRTQFKDSLRNENISFVKYYDHLTELAQVMFEWKNLPETIDPRFLERCLYYDGYALFFKDDAIGYLCLRTTLAGPFNVYDVPTKRKAYASNGYHQFRNETNSVVIYNNYLHTNSMIIAQDYSHRLADLENAIMVNCKAQKTPTLITCEENQRLSLENLYMKYEGNMPVIFGEKDISPNSVKAISTGAPFVADKLYQIKMQLWNEALTDLGISNVSFQKKERLVSDEVVRNMGGTIASRYSRLEMRRQACNQINEMFGLNIEVDYRDDYRENDDETMLTGDSADEAVDMAVDMWTR